MFRREEGFLLAYDGSLLSQNLENVYDTEHAEFQEEEVTLQQCENRQYNNPADGATGDSDRRGTATPVPTIALLHFFTELWQIRNKPQLIGFLLHFPG